MKKYNNAKWIIELVKKDKTGRYIYLTLYKSDSTNFSYIFQKAIVMSKQQPGAKINVSSVHNDNISDHFTTTPKQINYNSKAYNF